MKVTKSRLKQLIKEELQKVLSEEEEIKTYVDTDGYDVFPEETMETPRQTLRRLSKKHGGLSGIMKLDRNNHDRKAYRAAYKQLRGSKSNRAMAKKDKVRPIKFKEPKLSVQAAEKDYVPVGVSDPQEPTVAAGRGKTQKSHELGSRPTLSNYQPNSLDLDLGAGGLASYLNSPDDEERAFADPSANPRK